MSFFEGVKGVLTSAMTAIYDDGTLYRSKRTDAAGGAITVKFPLELPIKVQKTSLTQAQITAAGDRYTNKDVRLIVLQTDADNDPIDPPINDEDQIEAYGIRWVLGDIMSDATSAYWTMRGTPS